MEEHNFKNSCEFAEWSNDMDIYNMEYLGTLSGRKSQVCFEVDIRNTEKQLVCIDKSACELFFISQEEMEEWVINNEVSDIINTGYSDVFIGFNEFSCKRGVNEMTCFIDASMFLY